ncbi:AAA family ATPase [Oscillatoria sp. HE19RPO]|uniref:AAA family ATPase n=1 Tax=Oscillatoria sp. HE19RPO TaxID=2954806 RepID=UPI0020C40731|nr:AAA family ATPase [Oscillatoria sp. HE19RPO]
MLNYKIIETLYESSQSIVYRTVRRSDRQSVIIKLLKDAYPSPEKIAKFKREYELTQSLELYSGIVDVYTLETYQNRWFIALEDFDAKSLANLNLAGQLSLTDFLSIAVKIAEILGYLHQHYIIHKDINPSNILFNPTTQIIKLIDLGISTVLSRETSTFRNPNLLEGTLAYISPEQTGRMNRTIDYRSDFYSLGATFYELLTGRLPFLTTDPLELVHSHLAKSPVPPHQLNPNIPEVLSQIVLKLMSKNAEDRYQSALGLKADLEQCLNQWQAIGQIQQFLLATQDSSDRLQIPQKLYGREVDVKTLLAAYERVAALENAATELMLVSGYSGIGKTALVQEIYKPITRSKGYFISGKFEQLQRNIPYASLIQALRALMKQLLIETEAEISGWQKKLLEALGANAQVIIAVIPEVETILGKQPEVPELPPSEAQNRFNLVFQNFIKVFTQPEHPLVLFLDDLQWADSASLKLIQLLMTSPDIQSLFLIGAYRDNEVSAAHPLMLTLEDMKKAEVRVNNISLQPLSLLNTIQLIADTLKQTPEKVQTLSDLVQAKTGGNPFFMTQFLNTLYSEKLLCFNYQNQTWNWDIGQIKAQPIADNVVDLMAAKLNKLTSNTLALVKFAACIGNQFDLATLALISENSPRETALALTSAMNEGFIIALSDDYQLMELDVEGLGDRLSTNYQFGHDRIQQAAYFLMDESEKQSIHRQIGRLLLQTIPPEERDTHLFDIVNQLNLGQRLISNRAEQEELACLNREAGKKAKASAAYQSAFNYLQGGLELLPPDSWQQQYELTLALYGETAEAAYLSGHFERMEQLCEVLLASAQSLIDRVAVYQLKIRARMAQSQLLEAIDIALEALKLLGITFPDQPSQEALFNGFQETKAALEGGEIEDLIDLPDMTDPIHLAVLQLMLAVSIPCFIARVDLLTMMMFKIVCLSVEYGNTKESIPGYALYAIIVGNFFNDIESGYRFGKVALTLVEKPQFNQYKARTYLLVSSTFHWKEHNHNLLTVLIEGYKNGIEMGDFEYGTLNAATFCINSCLTGKDLPHVVVDMKNFHHIILKLKQPTILNWHDIYWQLVLNFMNATGNPSSLVGEAYNEEKMLPIHLEINDKSSLINLYLSKLILSYHFHQLPEALENANIAENYYSNASGGIHLPILYLYNSLTHLALYPDCPEPEQQRILEKVTANQEKMQNWAQHAPMNYLHKYYLVEAERARVLNNDLQARDYYDRAISLAKEHEYLNEEALAYELAARFYMARNIPHLARFYLVEAHYAYQRWGATAKVKHLETRYPELIELRTSTSSKLSTTSTSGSSSGETLDIATVLKASQAISSEIQLNKLLAQLLTLAIENAGAQKGVLILSDNNQLKIEAAKLPNGEVQILESLPLESGNFVPPAIINYVARTQENVILANATQEGIFTSEPYILQQQTQSLLCAAIVNQGKLIGILYLENNLATGAFTQERIELLQVISAQAAISLENAQLYRTLEDKVIERTAQLASANEEISALNELLKSDNLRMSAELDVTRQLQQKMLPNPEELQAIPGLEIAGFMEPADEIGGDYYDVLNHEGHIKIGIGDVTGHGLEAGMVMVMVQTAVRTLLVNDEKDYVKFLNTINRMIHDNVQRMRTDKNLTLALLDYADRVLRITGQHEEVLVVRGTGEIERLDTVDLGFPVGLELDISDFITQAEVELNPGDGVVLYTDGIPEAENMAGEFYGMDRLCAVVSQYWQESAEAIREGVIQDVREFIGEQKVFDDITLVVMKQR